MALRMTSGSFASLSDSAVAAILEGRLWDLRQALKSDEHYQRQPSDFTGYWQDQCDRLSDELASRETTRVETEQ